MKKSGLLRQRWLALLLLTVSTAATPALSQAVALHGALRNATVLDAVREINRQSGGTVSFMREQVELSNKSVTLDLEGKSAEEALTQALQGTSLSVVEQNGNLLIIPQAQQPVAQPRNVNISGRVVNAAGQPMVGVSVQLQGTTRGVNTDANGLFVLARTPLPATVRVSFVGYEARMVTFQNGNLQNIVLTETMIRTQTAVIDAGMQSIRKEDMTGSYAGVKFDSLPKIPTSTLENLMQGQVAGLVVTNPSGLVGTRQQMKVRGTSTLLGNQDVLWVVDGIVQTDPLPFQASDLNNFTQDPTSQDMMRNFVGSAIAWLNPNDIDQITILKDAASTVLYGVKGANGVIVITTKKGKAGRMSVNYSGGITMSKALTYQKMNLMNSKQRIAVSREIWDRRMVGASNQDRVGYEGLLSQFMAKEITYDEFDSGVKYLEQVNTDWLGELFRNPVSHTHNLSLSGGEEKITYYTSINGSQNIGTARGNDQSSYGATAKIQAMPVHNVYINFGLTGQISNTSGFMSIDPYRYATTTSRAIPLYNEDGSLFYYQNPLYKFNILNELNQTGNKNEMRSINLNANVRWDIIEGLTVESTFGMTSSNNAAELWASERSYYVASGYRLYDFGQYGSGSPEYEASRMPHGGILNTSDSRALSFTWRNHIAFNRLFRDRHRIGLIAGNEVRSEQHTSNHATYYGYMPDMGNGFAQLPETWTASNGNEAYNALSRNTIPSLGKTKNNYLSFYANATYSFNERYVAMASFRNDASNRFGQDKRNRFLPVWSVGGRWNISRENFMANLPVISELNIHGSYGWQGNVAEGYGPELLLRIPNPIINDQLDEPTLQISNMPYADLRWEKTGTFNIGADLGLWDNRFVATAEVYRKKTQDMIIMEPLPYEYGMAYMPMNNGTMLNRGWELTVGGTIVRTKDWVWSLSLNTGKNVNKITSEIDRSNDWRAAVAGRLNTAGYAANSLWAFDFTGVNPETGAPMFNIPTAGSPEWGAAENDVTKYMKYMGKIDPDFSGGLSTTLRWKTLTLSTNFNVSIGGKRFLYNMFKDTSTLPSGYANLPAEFADRWSPSNPDSQIPGLIVLQPNANDVLAAPRILLPGQTGSSGEYIYSLYNYSTARVADASYLRCNNISLSYTFTESVLKRLNLQNLQVSASVSNPFIIVSKDFKGMDPEVATGNQPRAKVWSMSLSVGF